MFVSSAANRFTRCSSLENKSIPLDTNIRARNRYLSTRFSIGNVDFYVFIFSQRDKVERQTGQDICTNRGIKYRWELVSGNKRWVCTVRHFRATLSPTSSCSSSIQSVRATLGKTKWSLLRTWSIFSQTRRWHVTFLPSYHLSFRFCPFYTVICFYSKTPHGVASPRRLQWINWYRS